MKKLVSFTLAAIMLLSLAACGGGPDADGSDAPSAPSAGGNPSASSALPTREPAAGSAIEPTPTPEPTKTPSSFELTSVEGFVNGWAHIWFRDTEAGGSYEGVIDANGKLHAYFNRNNKIYGDYAVGSGRFYGQQDKTWYVIDTKGQVHTYPEVQEVNGYNTYIGGYRYVTERKSGFDAVEYVTYIYDPDGAELTSISGNPYTTIRSDSEGIFLIENPNVQRPNSWYSLWVADLYFAQSDTWVKEQVVGGGLNSYKVEDGIMVYRVSSNSGYYDADHGEVCYADVKGKTYTITVPKEYGESPFYLCTTNGVLLFTDTGTNAIYCYNTKASQWTRYQGAYQDKVYDVVYNTAAGDGHFTLPLRGADGKIYWVLLNEKLEELTEPTLGAARWIQNGAVYVETNNGLECCDLKGSLLNTFKNYAYTSYNYVYRGVENGVVCVYSDDRDNNRTHGYYKTDGAPAFEIDFSTGVEVTELGF